MTDLELENALDKAAKLERRITRKVLQLICLAEDRKLYAKRGYPSLHKWLVERFKYSDSAAARRISAAKILRALPEVAAKVEEGAVNLSTLNLASRAVREHEKQSGQKLSAEQKSEVIGQVENKSASKAEAALMTMFPEISLEVKHDHKALVDANTVRVSMNLPKEVFEELDRLRLQNNMNSLAEVVALLLRRPTQRLTAAAKKRRAKIFAKGCEYRDEQTGRVCGAQEHLEVDHVIPVALGGSDEPENLRCLCRTHNQLAAQEKLGEAADSRGPRTRRLRLLANNRVARFRRENLGSEWRSVFK
jgi:hypothetical protein